MEQDIAAGWGRKSFAATQALLLCLWWFGSAALGVEPAVIECFGETFPGLIICPLDLPLKCKAAALNQMFHSGEPHLAVEL